VIEEKRLRCLGHLWDTSFESKEDLLVLMLACCVCLVVARVFMVFLARDFTNFEIKLWYAMYLFSYTHTHTHTHT
jgi:hypothetical protein